MAGKGQPKTGGRKKNTPNKTTREAKDVIASVAEGLGGATRMLEWAKRTPENESSFWKLIYPKLLPLTVAGDKDNPLLIRTIERRIVHANN